MLIMRSSFLPALGIAVSVPAVFAADCDRACLKGMLDLYLNAVIQHNPSAVPLTPGYRQTENAVVRRPGQGIWQTAKALAKVQRRYFDPVTQNTAYFGTLEEASGNAAVVTLRLKVADRKVAEAEWYLARKGDPGIGVGAGSQANNAFWDLEYLAAHPPVERVVSKAERVSREDLIAITNSYFDSLSARDGDIIASIQPAHACRLAWGGSLLFITASFPAPVCARCLGGISITAMSRKIGAAGGRCPESSGWLL
jgi:hypothetical protein